MHFRLWIKLLTLFFVFGCAVKNQPLELISSESVPLEEIYPLLADDEYIDQLISFKKLVKEEPQTESFEEARIEYLFERLGKSRYNFIRNGSEYSTARAIVHLRWKYFRHRSEAKSVDDFLRNVACRSRTSGEPYFLQDEEGNRHSLREVFLNELEVLDRSYIAHHNLLDSEQGVNEEQG